MLNQYHDIPTGLLECSATELHDFLGGPTLIHLKGHREPALFVSVLMHGNETTGWDAVRALLKKEYAAGKLTHSRSLSLFIANTNAAKHGLRHLPSQPDFNRVWPGSELEPTPEHELMGEVFAEMQKRTVFASIDIHNNTGMNPHYACVNKLDAKTLQLATLFGRTVVYFIRPMGVQAIAISELCPSVTLECGKAEHQLGIEHALTYLTACIHLKNLPTTTVAAHDIDLFHTTATVKIADGIAFGFDNADLDLSLAADLERYNFRELAVNTVFGQVKPEVAKLLSVTDEDGKDVFQEYFTIQSNQLKTSKVVMPSMLTRDLTVIRQDCLCYLMERYHF